MEKGTASAHPYADATQAFCPSTNKDRQRGAREHKSELARRGRFPSHRNPVGASVHDEERSGLAAKREGVKHSVTQKVTELRGKAHP